MVAESRWNILVVKHPNTLRGRDWSHGLSRRPSTCRLHRHTCSRQIRHWWFDSRRGMHTHADRRVYVMQAEIPPSPAVKTPPSPPPASPPFPSSLHQPMVSMRSVFSPCAYNPIKKPHVPLHEMCRDMRGKVPLFSLPGEKGRSFYKHFSVVCFSLNIILGEFHQINVEKFPLCIIYSTITSLMAVNFFSRILLPNDAINIFGDKNKQKHHNYLVGGLMLT